ncbi:MAG: cyclic nucleotide-binding domain-containing protein [Spirochaetes bacterium]|nr:cyclic nucleotide-binding domain-containing protein [Spirochaetota bacterium]
MPELKLKVFNANKDAFVFVESSENSNNFFIIKKGKARIIREVEVTDRPEENMLSDGDYFGVVSCMGKRPRLEAVQTITDCQLISVEHEQFIDLIKKNKAVALKILKLYSKKLRAFDDAITRQSLKKPLSSNPENLFQVGLYYYNNKEFEQAAYAFEHFNKCCPHSTNVQKAYQYLSELKPKTPDYKEYEQMSALVRMYKDKRILFCENEPGGDVFIIQEGKIKITKIVGDQEVLLAVLNPGDIVGEMALIENKPRSANAIAFGDLKVLAINQANFQEMVGNQPQITLKIIQLLSERIWVAYRQLENLAIPDEFGRILDILLIQIQKRRVGIERRKSIEFDFGEDELLNMAGFDKDKGNLHIKKLLEDPNFKLVSGKITVEDVDILNNQVEHYRKKIKKDR